MAKPTSESEGILARAVGLREIITAKHRKITVTSTDVGTYYFNNPSPEPESTDETPSIGDLEYIFQTNPVANKGVNLRANRVIGNGFDLEPSKHRDANPEIAESAAEMCTDFLKMIGYRAFFRQSLINAYVGGNEWTECVYNPLGHMIGLAHGDMRTIDFQRNFISNKIMLDGKGEPVGFWQYIENLAELYYSLSTYYGNVPSYENMEAAKNRLKASQSLTIRDDQGNVMAVMTTKPNYMFLKKEEIAHLSVNNLNDNHYGYSLLIPAYDALHYLNMVLNATAEAIDQMGYPKPLVKYGDDKHPATENMAAQAETLVQDPKRKEAFCIPGYFEMTYLQPSMNVASGVNDYPQWFVTAAAMGMRVPRELLTGEGESNRATAVQNATDFDREIESDRRALEEYIHVILGRFLKSRGFLTTGEKCVYVPEIKWPEYAVEEEALKRKMTLEAWQAGLLNFNEARKGIGQPEVEDREKAESYVNETPKQAGTMPDFGGLTRTDELGVEKLRQVDVNKAEPEQELAKMQARHALAPEATLDSLNQEFGTEGVNYRQVAQESVGKKIKSVDRPTARKIRDALVNSEARGRSAKTIRERIKEIGGYTEQQARMVQYTETRNLEENGELQDAIKQGFKFKTWKSTLDADTSPICRALHNKKVPIDADFEANYEESGKKKTWRGKAPAAHPWCRASLEYSTK